MLRNSVPSKAPTPSETYDAEVDRITSRRGAVYGHPIENFRRTADLWAVLFGHPVTELQVAAAMRLVKEARLMESPRHIDSLVDISGYARTSAMCIDKLQERDNALDDKATNAMR